MSARWKGCWEKRVSETTWLYSPWISFTIAPNVNRGYEILLFKSEEGRKKALKTFMGTECLELLNFVSNFILEGAWQFASLWRQTLLWVIFKGEGTKAALAESQRCEWLAVFSVVSGSHTPAQPCHSEPGSRVMEIENVERKHLSLTCLSGCFF